MIKHALTKLFQFLHIAFIGLPLAITLYCTAHLFFELKRLLKWTTN